MNPEGIALLVTAISAAIKMYFDYCKNRNASNRADRAENRNHELELIKAKSDAAIRATIVGIERHKKTMTPSQQRNLSNAIRDAALQEEVEGPLHAKVKEITERKGTRYYEAVDDGPVSEETKAEA